jgi:hypothetical protein
VRDYDELRLARHFSDQAREPLDICLIEGSIHFIQDAEWARLVFEYGHQQSHGRKSALATRQQ